MIQRTITINGKTRVGYVYEQPTNAEQASEILGLERALRQREGGYPVGQYWYHSDYDSKLQQLGLVMLGLNIPANLQWKTMSGAFVPMTPTLANTIFQAASAYESQLFNATEQKRSEVRQPNYDFKTFDPTIGWPLAYWEV